MKGVVDWEDNRHGSAFLDSADIWGQFILPFGTLSNTNFPIYTANSRHYYSNIALIL